MNPSGKVGVCMFSTELPFSFSEQKCAFLSYCHLQGHCRSEAGILEQTREEKFRSRRSAKHQSFNLSNLSRFFILGAVALCGIKGGSKWKRKQLEVEKEEEPC